MNNNKVAREVDTESISANKRRREESFLNIDNNGESASLKPAPFYHYVDRSKEPDEDPSSSVIPPGGRLNLPAKIHVILSRPDLADIVSWMPHGRAWRIHNTKEFESRVIPQFWDKCNMTSFVRQVNAWGFIRIIKGKDQNCYYNEYFLRGLPRLCKKMHRGGKDKNRTARRGCEPDLYTISEIHPIVSQPHDCYDLDMLKATMLDGPNGRMPVHLDIGRTQQNMKIGVSPTVGDVTQSASYIPFLQKETLPQVAPLPLPRNGGPGLPLESFGDMKQSSVDPIVCDDMLGGLQSPSLLQEQCLSSTPQQQLRSQNKETHLEKKSLDNEMMDVPCNMTESIITPAICDIAQSELQPPPLIQRTKSPQPPEAAPPPRYSQNEELEPQFGSLDNLVHRQEELSRWQAFIFPYIQMGVGSTNTWSFFTNWWVRGGSIPALTEEEEKRQMEQLPLQERIRAKEDVVGSSSVPSQDLSDVAKSLALSYLRTQIDMLPREAKVEYLEAKIRCSEFFDEKYLLSFLESERFDATATTQRLMTYWRLRVDTFGPEKAYKRLTISNTFPEEDVRELRMGHTRILPVTDLYGRSIIIIDPGRTHGKKFCAENLKLSLFYTFHTVLDRPGITKNGIVSIFYGKNVKRGQVNLNLGSFILEIFNCFPFSMKAMHMCYFNQPYQRMMLPFIKFFLSPKLRPRLEVHTEVDEELLCRFRQIGMPPERLPTELGGTIKLDHETWVTERIENGL